MTKKMIMIFFSVLLVFSLSACKSNTNETANMENQESLSSSNTSTAENSSAPAETSSTNLTTETKPAEEPATQKKTEESTTAEEITTAKKTVVTTAKETAAKKRNTATTARKVTTTKKVTTTEKTVATTKPNYNVNSSNSNVKAVYNLVNQERSKNGLGKFVYRNDLQNAADIRAKELAKKFDHNRPNGKDWNTAINVSFKTAGENIAYGSKDAASVMSSWMNSQGHKDNILSKNFTGIAVGCYEENGVKYWVQLFVG